MWLWLFIVALCVLSVGGVVFQQFFWWSVVGSCVLWAVAILAEITWISRQQRAVSRNGEEQTSTRAAAASAPSERGEPEDQPPVEYAPLDHASG